VVMYVGLVVKVVRCAKGWKEVKQSGILCSLRSCWLYDCMGILMVMYVQEYKGGQIGVTQSGIGLSSLSGSVYMERFGVWGGLDYCGSRTCSCGLWVWLD